MTPARIHLAAVDPVLHAATEGLSPHNAHRPSDPYLALLRAIVGQQLSVKAASTIWARVEAHFDGDLAPDRLLATDDDTLRGLGLSYRKASYIKAVATEAAGGGLDEATLLPLDDAAIIDRLSAIRGVGRWTVEMILLFGLNRPDVFSAGDLALRQAMVGIYGLTETGRALEKRVEVMARVWSPHRSTASRLLWAWHNAR